MTIDRKFDTFFSILSSIVFIVYCRKKTISRTMNIKYSQYSRHIEKSLKKADNKISVPDWQRIDWPALELFIHKILF